MCIILDVISGSRYMARLRVIGADCVLDKEYYCVIPFYSSILMTYELYNKVIINYYYIMYYISLVKLSVSFKFKFHVLQLC